jgi:hypothetical protein
MRCSVYRGTPFSSLAAQRDQRDFPALCAWIDQQYDGSPRHLWSSWSSMVATVAIILAVGNAIFDDRIINFDSGPIWALFGISVGASALVLHFISLRRHLRESRVHGNQVVNSRQALIEAREQGSLKDMFGVLGAERLDRAASHLLRLRDALDSEAWRSSETGVLGSARENSLASAEAAMSRLILLTTSRKADQDGERIVVDLEALANEAEQLTFIGGRDRSAESGLREALSELREIRKATEEARDSLTLKE